MKFPRKLPSVLIVVAALVFFVPKFETFYARIELPLPTKILLGASTILTQYWLILIVVGVVAGLVQASRV